MPQDNIVKPVRVWHDICACLAVICVAAAEKSRWRDQVHMQHKTLMYTPVQNQKLERRSGYDQGYSGE